MIAYKQKLCKKYIHLEKRDISKYFEETLTKEWMNLIIFKR